jgi:hypothetical protein
VLAGSSFFMSDEGALEDGALLEAAEPLLLDDGAPLEVVAPDELAGGVDGDEVVAGGVEAEGAVDFEADLEASSPHAASARAAAAISSTFFIWTFLLSVE